MTIGFRPDRRVLPPPQQAIWNQLAPVQRLGFVLYGGTAVALRLGHRISVDFDFFTDAPLDHSRLRAELALLKRCTTLQESPDTLTVLSPVEDEQSAGVKLSFFGGVSIGRVGFPDITDDGVLQVASLDDLLGTKLKVILQRVEAKDYVDIAAMIAAGMSLAHGLAVAKTLFGGAFQPSESLKALTWFEGGDLETLPQATRSELIGAASAVRDLPRAPLADKRLAILDR